MAVCMRTSGKLLSIAALANSELGWAGALSWLTACMCTYVCLSVSCDTLRSCMSVTLASHMLSTEHLANYVIIQQAPTCCQLVCTCPLSLVSLAVPTNTHETRLHCELCGGNAHQLAWPDGPAPLLVLTLVLCLCSHSLADTMLHCHFP